MRILPSRDVISTGSEKYIANTIIFCNVLTTRGADQPLRKKENDRSDINHAFNKALYSHS